MIQPTYQPKFRLLVGGKDVTRLVDGEVALKYNEGFITTLEFRIKHGIYFVSIDNFRGAKVEFWGGYTEGQYKKMFTGSNTFMWLDLEQGGLAYARCECFSESYASKTGENKPRAYPTINSDRKWANVSSIKTSEVVRQLISNPECMGAKIGTIKDENGGKDKEGIIITEALDRTLTRKTQIQSDGSDWGTLAKIAISTNCSLYEEYDEENGWCVFFVAMDAKTKHSNTPDLVYIGREAINISWNEKGEMNYVTNERFGTKQLSKGQIQLINFTVTEDFKVPLFRQQYNMDSDKYDVKNDIYASYDVKTGKWFYYIGDWDKFYAYQKKNPDVDVNCDAVDYNWLLNTFFRKVSFEEGDGMSNKRSPTIAKPYPVRRASGICRGNVSLMAYVNYHIYGISERYSSDNGRLWYAISMKHIWGEHGYTCEFDFIQP